MAKLVTTIPQAIDPFFHLLLSDLINSLPETVSYQFNIGLSGRIRLGRQSGAIHFVAATDEELGQEVKEEFSAYVRTASNGRAGGTVSNAWRVFEYAPLWVYSAGKKILKFDDGKLIYTEPPQPVDLPEWLPASTILDRIRGIEWNYPFDCYFTGGMVRENGSFNDVDFIVGKIVETESGDAQVLMTIQADMCRNVRAYLQDAIRANVGVNEISILRSLHVDVGSVLMTNKGPVYCCKIFDGETKSWCGPNE